jgi:hypothetical protein
MVSARTGIGGVSRRGTEIGGLGMMAGQETHNL